MKDAALILGRSHNDRIQLPPGFHPPASSKTATTFSSTDTTVTATRRAVEVIHSQNLVCKALQTPAKIMRPLVSQNRRQLRAYVSSIRTPSMVNREPLDRWPTYRSNCITQSPGIPRHSSVAGACRPPNLQLTHVYRQCSVISIPLI